MKRRGFLGTLLIVVLVSAVLLGCRMILTPTAEARWAQERAETMRVLLPGSEDFSEEEITEKHDMVTGAYKSEKGYVVEVVSPGYGDDITMWVGVDSRGTVTGLTLRDMAETAGLGRRALRDEGFLAQFLETRGNAEIGAEIHAISGATVTSRAVAKGVNAAVAYVTGADISTNATEWGG